LQHVLQTEEDNISEETDESEFDRKGLTKLASNLMEQFEVLLNVERNVSPDKLRATGHAWELDEDAVRIAAELNRIEDDFKAHSASMPPALQNGIQSVRTETAKRAKTT
jgi:hypothetical protein